MATDIVTAVSDRSTDAVDVLFNTSEGHRELTRRGVPVDLVASLSHLGLSSICNLVASIEVAKRLRLGAGDLVVTVATDSAALYGSERVKTMATFCGPTASTAPCGRGGVRRASRRRHR